MKGGFDAARGEGEGERGECATGVRDRGGGVKWKEAEGREVTVAEKGGGAGR